MAKRRESFFWTSYSDLMTSLFLVMLVLFVLVIVLLYSRERATKKELEQIKEVVKSTEDLEGKYFKYNVEYKKFELNIKCNFPIGEYKIDCLSEKTRGELKEAGDSIANFLDKHAKNQYLVIIEGQASKDSYPDNYVLSYRRALSLVNFWKNNGVEFGDNGERDNGELQTAGSGDGTIYPVPGRDTIEVNNQRFLVYVIPKNIINDTTDVKH